MARTKCMARLTGAKCWHVYAGGTCAASDKHGYVCVTNFGRYVIQPISSPTNCERHVGYMVTFENSLGSLPGGLHQTLGGAVNLVTAKKLCQTHFDAQSPFGGVIYPGAST